MILSDYHVHTTYCDGKNTPREMVLAAIEKGIRKLGFSAHSYTDFDKSYCLTEIEKYKAEINSLKAEFKDKIEIFCGVEQDYYSAYPVEEFDYAIGSVHYFKLGEEYIPVDETAEILVSAADKYFGGDLYSLAEEYFKTVADLPNKQKIDFIGHFDLISKFCEKQKLFETKNERYVTAWKSAVDKLIPFGIPFEINTGALSRGHRSEPYPSFEIQEYIKEKGGKFILSSDSHRKDTLCFNFENIKTETVNIF